MTEFTVRGVPGSIANDGWWLTCAPSPAPTAKHQQNGRSPCTTQSSPIGFLLIIALILLADFLFWEHSIGISLVIFSAGLSGAAIASLRPQFTFAKWGGIAGIWIACVLPTVEYTQLASVFILVTGHLGLLIWCALQSSAIGPVIRNLIHLPYVMPVFSYRSGQFAIRNTSLQGQLRPSRETVMAWLLPLIASSVFLLLFWGANPLFERWLERATRIDLSLADPSRMVFWACTAFAIYPFVAFTKLAQSFRPEATPRFGLHKPTDGFINARSITISLCLFNVMFLAQNVTDIAFLRAAPRCQKD
ncbi:DUF4153 domain-containing protein [Pseudophaeobacter leonis]|uniref:DUF4153 domain-containing protein n=1 Tax=Pseudophaeobacter leonis TaxID=1144477 RepID=UPI00111BE1F6|nr:DUF4153 domain-containing protein [Pseudophaeobacter leonis]